jgi:hypothetical protein
VNIYNLAKEENPHFRFEVKKIGMTKIIEDLKKKIE